VVYRDGEDKEISSKFKVQSAKCKVIIQSFKVMNNEEFKNKLINRSFLFGKSIIQLIDRLPNRRTFWIISDQLLRAATSIGANIIEAQAASSKRDFVNFLNHALKSANETKYWLALLKEAAPSLIKEIEQRMQEVTELARILGSSIATLKGKKKF